MDSPDLAVTTRTNSRLLPTWRALLVCLLILSWEGLLPAVFNLPVHYGRYFVASLVIAGVVLWFFHGAMRHRWLSQPPNYFRTAVLFYFFTFATSAVYTNAIDTLPLSEWLLAQYALTPLLVGFFLAVLRVKWRDVIHGVVCAAMVGAILTTVDQVHQLAFLDGFARGSINDINARRLVLLRVENGAAVVLVFASMIGAGSPPRSRTLSLLALSVLVFALFKVSESRQSILAVVLGIAFLYLLGGVKGSRKLPSLLFLLVAAPFVFFVFLAPYIEKFVTASDYVEDGNILIRLQALAFYYERFTNTYGLGFGILSNGDNATNFFAIAHRVGNGVWPYFIADIGILSALVQFGWFGLALVIYMSYRVSKRLISTRRGQHAHSNMPAFAIGCYLLGCLIHPWPMNFFTLEWTALFGGLMLFVSASLPRPSLHVGAARTALRTGTDRSLSA